MPASKRAQPSLTTKLQTAKPAYLIRSNAAEMIAEAGYDVVEAGNADGAIAILEARPDIHVIFTDIQMPGSMDGLKPEGGLFLPKPYSFDRISFILQELIA